MSSHSNFKQDKCWSCEFFNGQREYKQGIFFGDNVSTADKGTCTCGRSQNRSKTVSEHGWCSRYQKWNVLQSTIIQKKTEQEIQKMQAEQNRISSSRTAASARLKTEADRGTRKKLAKKIMKIALISIGTIFCAGLLVGLGIYLVSIFMMT